ncbi:SDR family oxidoreductase [Ancylomarina longa]|uniref:SDR family oxidoreductase n=1 Tax=Ancylomarina longa TaxID=2487017 RepID=A0A434AZR3_9BACT|nr:SDR family oxidoreductase [Ancylomarina longa]RUT80093.1 SDR family oxidoreductase [Ancylomarina longa]
MKYAFVTGSTKGIGKAIGIKLLQEDYFVIFNYANSDDDAILLESELDKEFSGQYKILKHDLSDINLVNEVSEKILEIAPKLDLLVFNTGLTDRNTFGEIEEADWINVFNANLNVPFFLMQSLSKHLNPKSNIIFIGSMLGNIPHSVSISYGVTKSAIHTLVQNMVKFLSKDEIRINAIAPGFVDTDWQKEKPDWLREKIKAKIALQRFAQPEEVAQLCYQIIQNEYLTGQIIQLDGGYNYE